MKIGKGKAVGIDKASKTENPKLAQFQSALLGPGNISLNGLKFTTAQSFLVKKAEAKSLQEEIGYVPSQEVVATYEQAQALYREAKLASIQLFDAPQNVKGLVQEHEGEAAAGATLKFLPGQIYKSAAKRIKEEGDLEGAKKLGLGEAEMKEVFQGRAKKAIGEIEQAAVEGPKAVKKEFRSGLKDLRKSDAPRAVIKEFKKEYRSLDDKPVAEIAVPTPRDPDLLDFDAVLASIPRKNAFEHSEKAAKACSDIKVIYAPKNQAGLSQKAVQNALAEYKAARQGFDGVKKRVEELNQEVGKLPKKDQAKYKSQLEDVNNDFAWYRQDVDAAYQSAKVSALDHNTYFPGLKMTIPQKDH